MLWSRAATHPGRPTQLGGGEGRGMAMFQAAGGWSAVVNGYMAAYRLLRRGWELMDKRGGAAA
jgi:hypothetical protein